MRAGPLIFLVSAACASSPGGDPESVRDRLASDEAQLLVTPAESTGAITAQRRRAGGWTSSTVELAVKSGELVVTADARGAITLEHLAVALGPIAIPESVLGYEAQLTDVHLEARRPAGVVTAWSGEDEARATANVELDLTWSLTIDGETSPLGAPKLPPVPIELVLTGDGAAIRAEARAVAAGPFWSWADLVKLEDLSLTLAATTVAR